MRSDINFERFHGWEITPRADAQRPAELTVVLIASRGVLGALNTLDSIMRDSSGVSLETLIVQRGGGDVTDLAFSGVSGIEVVTVDAEASLATISVEVLARATTPNLLFVEDDVRLLPGTLEAMRCALERAVMVGVKVLKPGSEDVASFGGRYDPDLSLRYNQVGSLYSPIAVRALHYPHFCPSVMAVRGEAHEEYGFAPPYQTVEVASAELASRLLVRGGEIVIPSGATSVLAYNTVEDAERDALLSREWGLFLSTPGFDKTLQALSRWSPPASADKKPIVLFIDETTPEPDRNSGSIDAVNMMRILMSLGFEVVFAPANLAYLPVYSESLVSLGVRVLHGPEYPCVMDILRELGPGLAAIFLSRAPLAARYVGACRFYAPRAKVVFNTVDLHYLRLERQAEIEGDATLKRSADVMKNFELAAVREADATIVLSSFELGLLRREICDQKPPIHVIPLIREVAPKLTVQGFTDRSGVLFVGTYQHPPNVDAARFMAEKVWPLAQGRLPESAKLYIVGSSATREILALHGDRVSVVGYVEDLDKLMGAVRVSVAPLRFGAGLKGKLASALQNGLPSVATSIAVEGTGLCDGKEVLVADEAESIADAIVRLHEDAELWASLSEAGFLFSLRRFSVPAVTGLIDDMLKELGLSQLT